MSLCSVILVVQSSSEDDLHRRRRNCKAFVNFKSSSVTVKLVNLKSWSWNFTSTFVVSLHRRNHNILHRRNRKACQSQELEFYIDVTVKLLSISRTEFERALHRRNRERQLRDEFPHTIVVRQVGGVVNQIVWVRRRKGEARNL